MPASANGTGLNRSAHVLEAGVCEHLRPGPPRLAAARYRGVSAPPINNAGEERGEVRRTASTIPKASAPARTNQPIDGRLATPKVSSSPRSAHHAAEIGRASCRERGESWVAGACVTEHATLRRRRWISVATRE